LRIYSCFDSFLEGFGDLLGLESDGAKKICVFREQREQLTSMKWRVDGVVGSCLAQDDEVEDRTRGKCSKF
jgi:hypothetical protein